MMVVRPYRPSNGSEGECFIETWCGACVHDRAYREGSGDSCPIVAAALAFRIDEPEYPKEWQLDITGHPICKAFKLDRGETVFFADSRQYDLL